jgi:hypothetical protein
MDKQLEEQLERMRRLNEQLNAIHRNVSETNELIARDRTARKGPLSDIRDFRTLQSHDYDDGGAAPAELERPRATAESRARRRRRR